MAELGRVCGATAIMFCFCVFLFEKRKGCLGSINMELFPGRKTETYRSQHFLTFEKTFANVGYTTDPSHSSRLYFDTLCEKNKRTVKLHFSNTGLGGNKKKKKFFFVINNQRQSQFSTNY